MSEDVDASAAPARPVLRVVRGDAGPEEVAALLVVLAAASGGSGGPADAPDPEGARKAPSRWNDRAAALRAGTAPGPGAWRSSAWPR